MPKRNIFDEPFDDGTLVKLEIFEDYAEAWLPTFIMLKKPQICVFDLFAGPGYDVRGVAGSPIRILAQIKKHLSHIFKNRVKVHVYLNVYDDSALVRQQNEAALKKSCAEFLEQHKDLGRAIEIHYYSRDCSELFWELLPDMRKYPSLVYLDQNGVKFLADRYLNELEQLRETDFLYYVSSSFILRFGNTPEFNAHLKIDLTDLKKGGYLKVHRNLIEQLRKKLPIGSQLKLYPFSIRKGKNIFGIIFGATHAAAVDKFLNIAWQRNAINGEADYDIDESPHIGQTDLFGNRQLRKIEYFQNEVRLRILSGSITNNFQLFDFVHEEGHIGTHAKDVLKKMKADGEVYYDSTSPLVTYEQVHQKKRQLNYTLQNKKQ